MYFVEPSETQNLSSPVIFKDVREAIEFLSLQIELYVYTRTIVEMNGNSLAVQVHSDFMRGSSSFVYLIIYTPCTLIE